MKDLMVGQLKEAFGSDWPEYSTIKNLTVGKPDNYVLDPMNVIDSRDYFVSVLWGREDIRQVMEMMDIEPTEKKIDYVFRVLVQDGINDDVNEDERIADMVYNHIIDICRNVS